MSYSARFLQASRLLMGLKRRQRPGFTLIELLVVVVIIGILASVALPSFVGAQDKARNSAVASNVNTIRMSLEQFATDNNGSYPVSSGYILSLSAGSYLPGGLPKAPWTNVRQTQTGIIAAMTASALATGGALASIGTTLGNGTIVNPPAAQGNYGFIGYDYDEAAQVYVVGGSGKKAKQSILVGISSNGSN